MCDVTDRCLPIDRFSAIAANTSLQVYVVLLFWGLLGGDRQKWIVPELRMGSYKNDIRII